MQGFDQKSISTTKMAARLVSLRAWKTLFKVEVLVLASCRKNADVQLQNERDLLFVLQFLVHKQTVRGFVAV